MGYDIDAPLPAQDEILRQHFGQLRLETRPRGFADVTHKVASWLSSARAKDGMVTLFLRHTSASLTIQENADPRVQTDLLDALDGLAPESGPYRHNTEGPDDMPAHIRTMLSDVSLSIPVIGGRMALGTWQAVYLIEHRARPHAREIVMCFQGSFETG